MESSNIDDTNHENTLTFHDIESLPGNTCCVDCDSEDPDWASLGFGVLICLQCAGNHRSLGVHISLVRSLNLDSWSPSQLSNLKSGGNDTFKAYVSSCCPSSSSAEGESQRELFENRYNNPEILYYKCVGPSFLMSSSCYLGLHLGGHSQVYLMRPPFA